MKRRRLTPGQRNTLRQLADQLAQEDPDLAEKFSAHQVARRRAARELRWERIGLVIGALLALAGIFLAVASAFLVGAGLIAVLLLRIHRRRQRAADAARDSGPQALT